LDGVGESDRIGGVGNLWPDASRRKEK